MWDEVLQAVKRVEKAAESTAKIHKEHVAVSNTRPARFQDARELPVNLLIPARDTSRIATIYARPRTSSQPLLLILALQFSALLDFFVARKRARDREVDRDGWIVEAHVDASPVV
ncbi:unnamed protein product [Zymoseptoria tritici ST99CH_1E4]|uniref:Uncharacterized protein n=1 Tax=Zymoseptoria tritici ST99CH_1E4 TaxID=1276532 RepID=A0A2H1H9V1_ZYMTR|nr:unnamed protein product [Zymoseptoria tritici ST99CH_1E4]